MNKYTIGNDYVHAPRIGNCFQKQFSTLEARVKSCFLHKSEIMGGVFFLIGLQFVGPLNETTVRPPMGFGSKRITL